MCKYGSLFCKDTLEVRHYVRDDVKITTQVISNANGAQTKHDMFNF